MNSSIMFWLISGYSWNHCIIAYICLASVQVCIIYQQINTSCIITYEPQPPIWLGLHRNHFFWTKQNTTGWSLLICFIFGIWLMLMESLCCIKGRWDVCVCDWTSAKDLWLLVLTAACGGCLIKGHIRHEIISKSPNAYQDQTDGTGRWEAADD